MPRFIGHPNPAGRWGGGRGGRHESSSDQLSDDTDSASEGSFQSGGGYFFPPPHGGNGHEGEWEDDEDDEGEGEEEEGSSSEPSDDYSSSDDDSSSSSSSSSPSSQSRFSFGGRGADDDFFVSIVRGANRKEPDSFVKQIARGVIWISGGLKDALERDPSAANNPPPASNEDDEEADRERRDAASQVTLSGVAAEEEFADWCYVARLLREKDMEADRLELEARKDSIVPARRDRERAVRAIKSHSLVYDRLTYLMSGRGMADRALQKKAVLVAHLIAAAIVEETLDTMLFATDLLTVLEEYEKAEDIEIKLYYAAELRASIQTEFPNQQNTAALWEVALSRLQTLTQLIRGQASRSPASRRVRPPLQAVPVSEPLPPLNFSEGGRGEVGRDSSDSKRPLEDTDEDSSAPIQVGDRVTCGSGWKFGDQSGNCRWGKVVHVTPSYAVVHWGGEKLYRYTYNRMEDTAPSLPLSAGGNGYEIMTERAYRLENRFEDLVAGTKLQELELNYVLHFVEALPFGGNPTLCSKYRVVDSLCELTHHEALSVVHNALLVFKNWMISNSGSIRQFLVDRLHARLMTLVETPSIPFKIKVEAFGVISIYFTGSAFEKRYTGHPEAYVRVVDAAVQAFDEEASDHARAHLCYFFQAYFRIPIILQLFQSPIEEQTGELPDQGPGIGQGTPAEGDRASTPLAVGASPTLVAVNQITSASPGAPHRYWRFLQKAHALLKSLCKEILEHGEIDFELSCAIDRVTNTFYSFLRCSLLSASKFLMRRSRYFGALMGKGPYSALPDSDKATEQLILLLRSPLSEVLEGSTSMSNDAAASLLTKQRIPGIFGLFRENLHQTLFQLGYGGNRHEESDSTCSLFAYSCLFLLSMSPYIRSELAESEVAPLEYEESEALVRPFFSALVNEVGKDAHEILDAWVCTTILVLELFLSTPTSSEVEPTCRQRCCTLFRSSDGVRIFATILKDMCTEISQKMTMSVQQARVIRSVFAVLTDLSQFPEIRQLLDEGGFKKVIIDVVRLFNEFEGDKKSKSRKEGFVFVASVERKPFAEEAKKLIVVDEGAVTGGTAGQVPAGAANVALSHVIADPLETIAREMIVSRSTIEIKKDSLLQLLLNYLEAEGLFQAASSLRAEAKSELGIHLKPCTGSPVKPPEGGLPTVETLERIMRRYVRQQHEHCPAPVTTIPAVDLLRPHQCPPPPTVGHCPSILSCLRERKFGRREANDCRMQEKQFLLSRCSVVAQANALDEDNTPTCIAFADQGKTLVVGTSLGDIVLYNVRDEDGYEDLRVVGHESVFPDEVEGIMDIVIGENNNSTAVCGDDGTGLFFFGTNKQPKFTLKEVKSAAFNPYFETLVTTDMDQSRQRSHIVDLGTGNILFSLQEQRISQENRRNKASFSPDGYLVLNDALLWDVRQSPNRSPICRFDKIDEDSANVFHPNGMLVIVDETVWDIRAQRILTSCPALRSAFAFPNLAGDIVYAWNLLPSVSSVQAVDGFTFRPIATVVPQRLRGFAIDGVDHHFAGIFSIDTPEVKLCAIGRSGGMTDPFDGDDADDEEAGEDRDPDSEDDDDDDDDEDFELGGDDSDNHPELVNDDDSSSGSDTEMGE